MGSGSGRSTGRTPVARLEERDRHVLAVAERLFLEKGYHQVSLALVASSAGVATRTIYARFGEKRALLDQIVACRREASELNLTRLAGERLPPVPMLFRLAAHAFEHELCPCMALLHADLLAERDPGIVIARPWSRRGTWRVLLDGALAPAAACLVDVFVGCLLSEQHLVGAAPSAAFVDRLAGGAVEQFLMLSAALLESRTRNEIEFPIRSAVLERETMDIFIESGVGART